MMKEKDFFVEKRKYIRLDLSTKVNFQIEQKEQVSLDKISAMSKNLSMKGVCFVYNKKIDPGTVLRLEIFLPDQSQPVHVAGQVRWSAPSSLECQKNMFDIGVKLLIVEKPDMERFLSYVCEKAFDEAKKHLK